MLRNWSLNPLAKVAIGILRKYGADAHIYLPGVGTVNGITAGNYLDSAGTTAASVDNPVGLSLDALQAMTLGVELAATATWISGGGPGSSMTITGDSLTGTSSTGSNVIAQLTIPTVAGRAYYMKGDLSGLNSESALRYDGGTVLGGGSYLSSSRTVYGYFVATGSTTLLVFAGADASSVGTLSAVSVKQVPGIHAKQGTTANKPILRRGLLNLLTQAQTYSHADWVENTTGTASAPTLGALQLAPDGTTTAQRVTFSCPGALISDQSMLDHASMTVVSGQPHTQIAYIKGTPGQTISFRNVAGVNYGNLTFDGTWQLLTRAETSIATTGSWSIGLRGTTGSTTGTVVADLWTAGLFQGTYTAQQILDAGGIPVTTTAAASNQSAGKYSWQFDGSNDSLSLSAPPINPANDHLIVYGSRCDAPGAAITICFASCGTGGAGGIYAGYDTAGKVKVSWSDDAAAHQYAPVSPSAVIGSNIVVGIQKTGTTLVADLNGVSFGTGSSVAFGTTTTPTINTLGSLGAGLNLNGGLYLALAVQGTVSASDALTLKRFVSQLSGVTGI